MIRNNLDLLSLVIFTIFISLVLIIYASAVVFDITKKEQTKQEAIKAGLVQNNEGHWVRPNLEEKK